MRLMPVLETEHLTIRPFTMADVAAVHQLYLAIGWGDPNASPAQEIEARRDYIQWSALNHVALARLGQPPYGDRAVVSRETGQLIGMCGLVPCVDAFGQLPYFGRSQDGLRTAEVGLMWAISPACQGQGYATEVAQALIDFAFSGERLKRIIATTTYDNLASQRVMRKLGMLIEHNPFPDPPWLQVVGILENHTVSSKQ